MPPVPPHRMFRALRDTYLTPESAFFGAMGLLKKSNFGAVRLANLFSELWDLKNLFSELWDLKNLFRSCGTWKLPTPESLTWIAV